MPPVLYGCSWTVVTLVLHKFGTVSKVVVLLMDFISVSFLVVHVCQVVVQSNLE